MNRTDRLHAIIDDLRRAGVRGRTSSQLAERFEVTVRTIKRDIDALQQAGHPIWATGGPGGGYVLDDTATLPALNFTAREAIAVAVALGGREDLPFAAEGQSALDKLLEAMPAHARQRAERLGAAVWIRRRVGSGGRRVMQAIAGALAEEVALVIDYVDRSGERTRKREVDPIYLGIDDGVAYLFAWDRGRRAGRTFRLDRITDAWHTTKPVGVHDFEEVFGRRPPHDVVPSLPS